MGMILYPIEIDAAAPICMSGFLFDIGVAALSDEVICISFEIGAAALSFIIEYTFEIAAAALRNEFVCLLK
jgi:uncharacterized cupredoxin-like copper-binding protein